MKSLPNFKTKIYKKIFYNGQKLKSILGIKNFEAFKKKKKRSILKFFFKKKYNTQDLINVMKGMGLQKDSVVFIHSSMTEFYNFTGTAKELIDGILEEIGENGTLIMPAYPQVFQNFDNEVDFDVLRSPSGAGYLTEVFRKYPGVKRSINLYHSVCAYGKLSKFFVSEHHLSLTNWDKHSPYYKMSQMNTLVFSFGLPYFLGTIIHCTESLLRTEYQYFNLFFKKKIEYKFRDSNGNIGKHQFLTHDFVRRRSKKKIIKKYFAKNEFKKSKISNLNVEMVDAKYTLDLYLKLARQGITMYSVPSPKTYLNKKGKFKMIV